MNIPNKFLQIGIFLANDGFISVLKKLPMSSMSFIIKDCITCKQSSHQSGYSVRPASEEEMGMVCHKCPCIALGFCFRKKGR